MTRSAAADAHFLAGGGACGRLMQQLEDGASPLGPPSSWPQSLRSVVGLLLNSKFPMFVAWGDELGFLYNDAYAAILGAKHPTAMGARFRDIWGEIWDDISPLIDRALAGEATYREDLPLVMRRRGFDEQTWFTFSYSPVRDESGRVAGMFCACTETTARVLAERRDAFLLTLQDSLRAEHDAEGARVRVAEAIAREIGVARVCHTAVEDGTAVILCQWSDGRLRNLTGARGRQNEFAALFDDLARGDPVAVTDVLDDARIPWPPGPLLADVRSLLAVPRLRQGRLDALMTLHHPVPRRWTADEVRLVQAAAERAWGTLDRIAAEARARESEARFRNMADHAPVMMWVTDAEGRCDYLNRAWYAFTGQQPWDALGLGWLDAAHPDDADEVAHAFRAANAQRVAFRLEYRLRHRDGTYRWVIDAAAPRFDADGGFLGYVGSVIDIEERRAIEESLRGSEAHLAAIVSQASVGISETDADGRFVAVNDAYCRIVGRPRDALLGLRMHALTHPDDLPANAGQFAELVGTGRPFEVVKRYLRPDGDVVWVHNHVTPLRDLAGGASVLCVTVDLTKRYRAEDALRESEARLRQLASLVPAFVWFASPDGALHFLNERWYAYTGQTPEVALPTGWADTLHPEDVGRVVALWERARATGDTYEAECRYRRHDGAYRWYVARAEPLRDPDGNIAMWFGTSTDIHARREAETALRALNETLEQRIQHEIAERNRVWLMSRDLFAVMGFDGYLKSINPAWTATLGFDEATLLARDFSRQVHPDDHASVRDVIERLRAGEVVPRFENRLRHADGGWRWIAWTLVPEGEVFYAVGRDVSAEREAAEQLERAQDALRQAQKMEAVGQLTGGIAHDFNNVLGAVMGGFDLIRRKPDDVDRVTRWAEHGLAAAERGAKLTAQLLTFARTRQLDLQPVAVGALLAHMREMLERTLGPLVRLEMVLGDDDAAVLSDATQLEMAVLNLAINARDAMPDGGTLRIATTRRTLRDDPELAPGDYVEIAVADTGTGMPADVAERAFEPFFTTKALGRGTGLGLSQVYGLARQAGGTARIDTRPGAGTTVRMLMPSIAPPGPVVASEPAAAAPSNATALVIDDDAGIRGVLVESLRTIGLRVVEAGDGAAGLSALADAAPDIVLVDYAMPGMSGADVARAIRSTRPRLPIVFITGYADHAAIVRAVGAEAPVLRKPFRIDDVHAVVERQLQSR